MADESKKRQGEEPERRGFWRGILFWIMLVILAVMVVRLFKPGRGREEEISYSRFLEELRKGNVASVTIMEKELKGDLRTSSELNVGEETRSFRKFKTYIPFEDPDLAEELVQQGVDLEAKPALNWWGMIWPYLPLVGILLVWLFFIRQMQAGPNRAFTFGKSRAKLMPQTTPKVTFSDVAGVKEAKEELQEIIEFLKAPQKFQRLGGRIPKGVLLLGPPGTGKTLLARAVAGEAGVPFFSISGSDFVELFVGVGASRVRDLFDKGKKNAPCIIFIDEIDAVGRHRGAGIGGGHDEREQTLNALLVEMDGFEANEGVILLAATNRPDVLDPALLRPGRFDRQVVIDRPDVKGREGILRVHSRKIPVAKDVNLEVLARGSPGFSGADLANMVNEAALLAARRNRKVVTMDDFEEAKDKVLMGAERKSLLISDEEKRSTAYHESGHVLVSKLTPGTDPIHKVTIIPRGVSLGVTQQLPIDERRTYSREYCLAQMAVLLGGRAAELVALGTLTTGAGNDIERATELARKMVCEWGMSEKLGPLTFGKKEEEIFLGREIVQHRDYSEKTAQQIDSEVRRIVEDAQKKAEKIVRENLDKLQLMANTLLERENLNSEEIDKLLKGEELPKLKRENSGGKEEKAKAESGTRA